MPGRKYSSGGSYRYGFNGKENDNAVKGEGNQQDYGRRIYDPRLGRFLSVDPLTHSYPFYSPYQFAGNEVIRCIDLDGGEPLSRTGDWDKKTSFLSGIKTYEIYDKTKHQIFQASGIVDPWTGITWIVADDGQNQNNYFYLVNDNKSTDKLKYYVENGRTVLYGGHFERFETRNEIDAKQGAEIAKGMALSVFGAAAGITAVFAAPVAVPILKSLVAGSMAERVAAATSDAAIQYASNSSDYGFGFKNLSHINTTSVVASFAMPNADFTSSFISNAFEFNKADRYVGVGSANANNKNILVNSVTGGAGNKLGSKLDQSISKYLLKGKATPFVSKLATENTGNVIPAVTQAAIEPKNK